MSIKDAYQEILVVCEKHSPLDSDIEDMVSMAKDHLLVIEWDEKYGIKINKDSKPFSNNYLRSNDFLTFCYYADAEAEKEGGSGRYISWPDNNKQPKNEWLLSLSFSTGAYIFGQDYEDQKQLFQDFFSELKTYKPDFIDSHNSSLYWRLENAKGIYIDFMKIKNKYHDINKSELNKRRAKKLREELEKLESNI